MDLSPVVHRLRAGADVFRALTRDVSADQARWKPGPDAWSILEVVCHLADEEVRDFRTRLDLLLHDPDAPWPPNDPEGWVVEERYNERSIEPELARFLAERERSVAWLDALHVPSAAWEHTHPGTFVGAVTAGDLLASWVAHDLIHVRQINRLHRQYLEAVVLPGRDPAYAGRWEGAVSS